MKRDLFAIQKMCANLAIDYTDAYEAGYMGLGRNSQDEAVTTTKGYSDPTGSLSTASGPTAIRRTNAAIATQVENVYRQMVGLRRMVNDYLSEDDRRERASDARIEAENPSWMPVHQAWEAPRPRREAS